MAVIETRIDIAGAPFAQNREDMLKLIADWRAIEAKGRAEEQIKRERYHQRGQILPRERVHLLLDRGSPRSEEHTSELQSLMRISYAVFCLKKKKRTDRQAQHNN